MVAAALVAVGTRAGAAPLFGADISYPQCGRVYPPTPAFAVIGVNGGQPNVMNPCLASEYRWALSSATVEFYLNTANTIASTSEAYTRGYDAARTAYSYALSVGAGAGHLWWLDVETANSWTGGHSANTAAIAGTLAFLRGRDAVVGIYSTRAQWGAITGGVQIPSVANWVPAPAGAAEARSFCSQAQSFSGGPVAVTQYTAGYDHDYVCPSIPSPPPVPPPNTLLKLLTSILNWLHQR